MKALVLVWLLASVSAYRAAADRNLCPTSSTISGTSVAITTDSGDNVANGCTMEDGLAFTFPDTLTAKAVLKVTGGDPAGALFVSSDSPQPIDVTFSGITFAQNGFLEFSGGNAPLVAGSSVVVTGCVFPTGTGSLDDSSIGFYFTQISDSAVTISDNTFSGAADFDAIGLYSVAANSVFIVEDNRINANARTLISMAGTDNTYTFRRNEFSSTGTNACAVLTRQSTNPDAAAFDTASKRAHSKKRSFSRADIDDGPITVEVIDNTFNTATRSIILVSYFNDANTKVTVKENRITCSAASPTNAFVDLGSDTVPGPTMVDISENTFTNCEDRAFEIRLPETFADGSEVSINFNKITHSSSNFPALTFLNEKFTFTDASSVSISKNTLNLDGIDLATYDNSLLAFPNADADGYGVDQGSLAVCGNVMAGVTVDSDETLAAAVTNLAELPPVSTTTCPATGSAAPTSFLAAAAVCVAAMAALFA